MHWDDPDKLKKWKPIAYLLLISAVLGAVGSLTGLGKKALSLLTSDDKFSGTIEILHGIHHPENNRFIEFLERNVGKRVVIDAYFAFGVSDMDELEEYRCLDGEEENEISARETFGNSLLNFESAISSSDITNTEVVLTFVESRMDCTTGALKIGDDELIRIYTDHHEIAYMISGLYFVGKNNIEILPLSHCLPDS